MAGVHSESNIAAETFFMRKAARRAVARPNQDGEAQPAVRSTPARPLSGVEASLQELLDRLVASIPGTMGAVVAHRNGLPIASSVRGRRVELIAVSAMAALAIEAGVNVARNLDYRGITSVTVEGETWKVVVGATPSGSAILLIMLEEPANLGLLKLNMSRYLDAIDLQIGKL
jgi:predicted regulator of Ras-like GTPase activity (Roadblock/LC7/MglB family)